MQEVSGTTVTWGRSWEGGWVVYQRSFQTSAWLACAVWEVIKVFFPLKAFMSTASTNWHWRAFCSPQCSLAAPIFFHFILILTAQFTWKKWVHQREEAAEGCNLLIASKCSHRLALYEHNTMEIARTGLSTDCHLHNHLSNDTKCVSKLALKHNSSDTRLNKSPF